jgi:hypothetical protein
VEISLQNNDTQKAGILMDDSDSCDDNDMFICFNMSMATQQDRKTIFLHEKFNIPWDINKHMATCGETTWIMSINSE